MFPDYKADISFQRIEVVDVKREYRVEQKLWGKRHWEEFDNEKYTLDEAKKVVNALSRLSPTDRFRVVRPAKVVYEV